MININDLNKAVNEYLKHDLKYRAKIMRAELDAQILATEYFVSAGLGFVKYLN